MAGRAEHGSHVEEIDEIVDLGKTTSFLDHVYLGCTQSESKSNESIIEQKRKGSNQEFLLNQLKNCLGKKQLRLSYDTEGHAKKKKCVEIHCWLANKKTEQLYKVSTPCLDDHNFTKEELETVGALVLADCVKKCLDLARIGRLDILWFVNKLLEQSQNGQELVTNA